jgi:hypothetical protein
MPGVTVGKAVEFLEEQAKQLPAGFTATTSWRTRDNMCRKETSLR